MKLLRLTLRNFQGIEDFTLDVGGSDASVYADNGVGKTTLFNAFTWLLFGKDSHNQTNFDLKTLDEHNNPIHGLEHEVEGVLLLDGGREVTLRRVYKEKWTKRRGSATSEMTGHTTDYFIDGVPTSQREYNAYIAELADENVFRLLSDPAYFNEHLHWEKRRELLLQVVGDVTDADVIASDDALAELTGILGDRELEDHRKVVMSRRTEVNKEIERIPVRIDEVDRGLPELPEADKATLEQQVVDLREQRTSKEAERTRIEAGGEVAEQRKRLAEIESQMNRLKNAVQEVHLDGVTTKQGRLRELKDALNASDADIRSLDRERDETVREIERDKKRMADLRTEWDRKNAEQFTGTLADVADACAACEQPLPADRVEEARAKAQANLEQRRAEFNERKATRLTEITAEGKRLKDGVTSMKTKIEKLNADRDEKVDERDRLDAEIAGLNSEIEALKTSTPDPMDDANYAALAAEKADIEAAIAKLQADNTEALATVNDAIKALDDQIASIEASIALYGEHERGKERIAELSAEERKLAAEFEKLEHELYLMDQFERTKTRMLDDKINSKFKVARFKMFREQVNGGIEPTCQTLLNGVPWPSINGAGRIQVGLDIINTLAEHYGFAPPVFVDDAVTVTDIPETTGQQIRLVVSAADKTLRVELDSPQQLKEAS